MKYENNPYNIRSAGQEWYGEIDEKNGFCQFEEMEYGIRAAVKILATYRSKYGLKCINDIIHRWAPPTENDTYKYIQYCCTYVGIAPLRSLIFVGDYYKLLVAMAKMETGEDVRPYQSYIRSLIQDNIPDVSAAY